MRIAYSIIIVYWKIYMIWKITDSNPNWHRLSLIIRQEQIERGERKWKLEELYYHQL
jgi:hypothetical protein